MIHHRKIATPNEERYLRDAMAPNRGEPEGFARAVERKLRAAEADHPRDGASWVASPVMRRVASFLPFMTAAKPMQTGAVATKFGWHSVLTLLALPVVAVVMMGVAFFFSMRQVAATDTSSAMTGKREVEAACKEWWQRYRWRVAVLFLVVLTLWYAQEVVILSAAIALSMVIFGVLVGLLGRWGLANRRQLAICCFFGFFFSAQFAQSLYIWMPGKEGFLLSPRWIPLLFSIGAAICAVLVPAQSRSESFGRWIMALLALLLGGVTGALALVPAKPGVEVMARHCAAFERGIFDNDMWPEWSATAEWVRRRGGTVDTAKARTLVRRAIDETDQLLPFILASATRLDLVDAAELRMLMRREHAEHLVGELLDDQRRGEVLHSLLQYEWLIRGLVKTGRLAESQVDVVETRLLASWPRKAAFRSLEAMVMIAGLLEAIGRPIAIEDHRESTLAQLRELWVGESGWFRPAGGFASSPDLTDSSDHLATHAATALMIRFGAPAEVDLRQLQSYLAAQSRPLLPFMSRDWRRVLAGVALDKLDTEVGYPALTLWDIVVSERLPIGVVLMIMLALYAVLRAKPMPPVRLHSGADASR